MDTMEQRQHYILSILKTQKLSLKDVEQINSLEALKHLILFDFYSLDEIKDLLDTLFSIIIRQNSPILKFLKNCEFIEKARFNKVNYYKLSDNYYLNQKKDIKKYVDILESLQKSKKKRILSKSHKEKIGQSHIGLRHSEQTRLKMKISHTGLKHTEKTREKMRQSNNLGQANRGSTARKPTFQTDMITGNSINYFESLNEASRKTGISVSSVWSACKKKILSAGGYGWRYATEKEINENL